MLIAFTLGACNKPNNQESVKEASTNEVKDMTSSCYVYANDKDTVQMTLLQLGTKVSGDLTYKLYEKDSNKGTIEGEISGDTLLANYTFKSEGVTSLRQVAFLKKGEDWIEGIGDVEGINGNVNFKNPHVLNFNNTLILKKATCEK